MTDDKRVSLRNLINGLRYVEISYRTYTLDGQDMFVGYCVFENGELLAGDVDSYSLDDRFDLWEWDPDGKGLTVWYQSEWIDE